MEQNFFSQKDLGGIDEDVFKQELEKANGKSSFNERMPQVGEIVIFTPNPDDEIAKSNYAETCAAIVTRVWSSVCVNLKIIPDHGPMQDRGSVTHHSANPAGYNFKFHSEVYSKPIDIGSVVFK